MSNDLHIRDAVRDEQRAELERERRECLEADPPLTGHHSFLTEKLRELDGDQW